MNSLKPIRLRRRRARHMPRGATAVMLLLLLLSSTVRGDRVVVVRSGDEKPFTQASTASAEVLRRAGHDVIEAEPAQVNWQDVQVVLAVGSNAALWAKDHAPAHVMLSYCMVSDADSLGVPHDRPALGVTTAIPVSEQINLMRQAMPRAKNIGLLYSRGNSHHQALLREIDAALPQGAKVHAVAMEDHAAASAAITALMQPDVDFIWTMPDATIYNVSTVRALLLGALRNGKPVYGFSPAFVRAGALVGTGIDPQTQGSQIAQMILNAMSRRRDGAWAGSPHKLQSPQFQIAVNLHVARELKINLSQSLVDRATFAYGKEEQ